MLCKRPNLLVPCSGTSSPAHRLLLCIMTINRDWVGVMKEECPEAFTSKAPFRPRVAFIDGMPLLMKSNTVTKWSELVRFNFGGPVRRFFGMGAKTVVLGFDVYSLVPMAKAITQANRSKHVAKIDFSDASDLPTCIPVQYNDFMRNRAFKRRVIQMVVETLPDILCMDMGQELIVDYESCPIRFCVDPSTRKTVQTFMIDMPPLGECDIKFSRWFRMYGDGIAHSVDGDFIPIALMEHESQVRSLQDTAARPSKIAIYRMEFGVDKEDEAGAGGSGHKRDAHGKVVATGRKRGRAMEYVSIQLLYECLAMALRQCAGRSHRASTSHDSRNMEMVACLIGLTGTDFTRNLPMIGVRKIWDMIADKVVHGGLIRAYDPDSLCMDVEAATNLLVARLYMGAYQKHVHDVPPDLGLVLGAMQRSKLADKTKSRLPTAARVDTTIRNINWLLQYWRCAQPVRDAASGDWLYATSCPDPVCSEYGYKQSSNRVCAVQWLDEA